MDIWYLKIKGRKIKRLEIRLNRTTEWDNWELNPWTEGNGIYITDIMHVFKANDPTSQLESWQKKNGYYFCEKLPKTLPIRCPYQTYL